MTTELYLSRAKLLRGTEGRRGALADLVANACTTLDGCHRLVWSLFDVESESRRPFVYRQLGSEVPEFLIQSTIPPQPSPDLWEVETEAFDPPLETGLMVRFSICASPVVRDERRKKHDVVQDARKRGDKRHPQEIAADLGTLWMVRQSERTGLDIDPDYVRAGNHRVYRFRKATRTPEITVTTIDIEGYAVVRDPERLREALVTGIGSAKAYGCGMLVVRPV